MPSYLLPPTSYFRPLTSDFWLLTSDFWIFEFLNFSLWACLTAIRAGRLWALNFELKFLNLFPIWNPMYWKLEIGPWKFYHQLWNLKNNQTKILWNKFYTKPNTSLRSLPWLPCWLCQEWGGGKLHFHSQELRGGPNQQDGLTLGVVKEHRRLRVLEVMRLLLIPMEICVLFSFQVAPIN